ncbi:cytochrome c biogenesis protein ResB [Pseudonocardia sp. HH130630-07]|uniref:cytochrome c biogenesis protein ResB n=1 Tax=Pseudonocardia sp. HH130630-07 TaxID=1690815 RepID=UPI0008152738|nr:cytochrome c biogenesis protein ResB [Pseudonocardia sp. HH130630-07]ANY07281.1 cytochrome C biogenesis protein ResB [Pseudonocardia sp. HH130630-07]
MSSPPTAPTQPSVTSPDGEPPARRQGPLRRLLAFGRNTWRGLTSMRTALVLLFLLAVAAVPGALLPQRSLNASLVDDFYADNPTIAPVVEAIGGFEVFKSPWFAAIYLLLMLSLVGCVLPRSMEYWRGMRQPPVATPRNLARLPHHAEGDLPAAPDAVLDRARTLLRGWRRAEHTAADGSRSISAERGYLRETGNLVFHFSLIAILLAVAASTLYRYDGDVIVRADGSEFCNSSILGYDSFNAGLQVDGTDLNEFCVRVDRFDGQWLPNGQPSAFEADIGYQTGADLENGVTDWRPYRIGVNEPLRTDGDRVYLTGYGYAPEFTVTWPDGQSRTGEVQWRPVDQGGTQLSEGATKFERPGVTDADVRRTTQIAVTGTFAPTGAIDPEGRLASVHPDLRAPTADVNIMLGDLGIDDGRGQSIFTVDQQKIDDGDLRTVATDRIGIGGTVRLPDGTTVRFDGVTPWVNLLVGHDPSQSWLLVSALVMLAGLTLSLTIKRRRIWVRVRPGAADGTSRVEVGGLARTDRAGYGDEFDRIAEDLLETTTKKDG